MFKLEYNSEIGQKKKSNKGKTMSALANYNPLKRIHLPGAEIPDPKGIIVIIGPNSSGKTLLLKDIEHYLHTGIPKNIVCSGIEPQKPHDLEALIKDLLDRNFLKKLNPEGTVFKTYGPVFKPELKPTSELRRPFEKAVLQASMHKFDNQKNGHNPHWFGTIGTTLSAFLSLDHRRMICSKVKSFDYLQATPDLPLQGLMVTSTAKTELEKETGRVFGNTAWLDISENGVYQLRVSGTKTRPPIEKTESPFEANKFFPIEAEGDGYRSYVGLCLSLLITRHPVSLIDEPELCLHPPQAHQIGRFIGNHAADENVVFVSTHSSHVLRGILETAKKVLVIRLTRNSDGFYAKILEEESILDHMRNPKNRSELTLDGLFSKGIILVESEGDREVYQAAAEAIEDYPCREVQFIPVGGIGGFFGPSQFFNSLGIPTSIIADLDLLCEPDKVAKLIAIQQSQRNHQSVIVTKVRELANRIKSEPITSSVAGVKEQLKSLSEIDWDWENGADKTLRSHLSELENQLKRIRRIKEGGLDAYTQEPEIWHLISEIIETLSNFGVFLVPVGELEGWVKNLMKDIPKKISKSERANIAANKIRQASEKNGDIWDFIKKVIDFYQ